MILKARTESKELIIMRCLNSRMTLSASEKQHYIKLEKGYKGEQYFDELTEIHLDHEYLILNDLTFEHNHTTFQIDSLLISDKILHPCEIKYHAGDYYISNDLWYTTSGKEIRDPILQLKRAESLLRSMLQELKSDFKVSAQVVFVNPEFTLYHAPMDLPMILPTQLNRFFKTLNLNPTNMKKDQLKIANQLLASQVKSSYSKVPTYEYEQLEKGISCRECRKLSVTVFDDRCVCENCGFNEDIEAVVLRSVEEFVTLFPDRKITTNGIQEWCQLPCSTKVLRKIMKKHFRPIGYRRHTYYVK